MSSSTQIRLQQITGSFGAGSGHIIDSRSAQAGALSSTAASGQSLASNDLTGILSEVVSSIKRVHGAASFMASAAGVFAHNIVPSSAGGSDIGSTSAEWGDVFLGDSKSLKLGLDQDVTLTHSSTSDGTLTAGGALGLQGATLDIDATGGAANIDATGAIAIGGTNSTGVTIGRAGQTVTLAGNLDVNGTLTTIDTTNTAISDHNIILDRDNSGTAVADGAGLTLDGNSGDNITFQQLASGDRMELKKGDTNYHGLAVGKLMIDTATNYLDVSTDLQVVSAADIVLNPGGNNVLPGGDSEDDLGVSGTAWRKLFVDDIDLNGQGSISMGGTGRIDLDADDDTSIRASADDIITFEAGGTDRVQITAAMLAPSTAGGMSLGSASAEWANLYLGDSSVLAFGDGQDVSFTHSGTDLSIAGAGNINVTSTVNEANAILIHANGGTSESIKVHADQGTSATSILVDSDVGGVKINAGLDGDAAAIHLDSASGITVAGGDQNDSVYFENSPLKLEQISEPSSVTDKLYNVSGELYWNGAPVAVGPTLYSKVLAAAVSASSAISSGFSVTGDADVTWSGSTAVNKVLVYLNGQLQRVGAGKDVTLSGSGSLTFTYALKVDDVIQVQVFK